MHELKIPNSENELYLPATSVIIGLIYFDQHNTWVWHNTSFCDSFISIKLLICLLKKIKKFMGIDWINTHRRDSNIIILKPIFDYNGQKIIIDNIQCYTNDLIKSER